jgi:hypothetical protein
MTISDKDRKILWARSGNRCAICKCELVIDKNDNDDAAVVGEECHIIAQSPNGPRGDSTKTSDALDEYENLILLCSTHHKQIDDQAQTFTTEALYKLKADHEKWVRNSLEPQLTKLKGLRILTIPLLRDAKEVVNIVSAAGSLHTDYTTPNNVFELSLIKDFIGEFEGLSCLSDELLYIADATFRIKDVMNRLEQAQYYIYGKIINVTFQLKTNREKMDWKHGFIVLKRFKLPDITIAYDPNFQF